MRRPLCLIGLAFVVVLLLGIYLLPEGTQACDGLDREQVTLLGVVEWKEHKISKGEEVLMVSLGQVIVLNPILKDSLENLPEKIRETTAKQLIKYCENNKTSLCLTGAEDIEGVLCYPKEEPAMGSVVMMEGKFYAFSHATNPGEFDGADYYRIMGQQGRLMQAGCLAQSRDYSVFQEKLYACREYLSLLLHACYPKEEASVMGAMLLGEKGTLDTKVKSLYQHNGIIHILAISGLHLSILGMGFYNLLKRLRVPILVDIILSIALMYCYGTMTGMGVSVVRALVMFGIKLCAPLVGRTYDMLTAM
ncbi:MAG: ComEC/Rec2 family competence protein, partial [Lachnospiraceae bacterium]|nr:ComEC/Rec2 family competence protein [Lachnospiraceae bacterium]